MKSKVTFIGGKELAQKFAGLASIVQKSAEKSVTAALIKLQKRVKQKLSNDVLKVQTGNLRSSIRYEIEKNRASIMGKVGTNVKYAPVHEFGLGKHKERSFLRSSLNEIGDKLAKDVKSDVLKDVKTHMKK